VFVADYPIEVRVLRPADDIDAHLDLAERSFGTKDAAERERWKRVLRHGIAQGRCLGAFAGGRLVGAARFHDMRQWWCGRAVPMAGVASVQVAPEDRGRGIGRLLMTALLDEIAARGYPLSVLNPVTMPLYRSLGWELAGTRSTAVIPARSLRDLMPPDGPSAFQAPSLRRAGPGDFDAVLSVAGRVHETARDCGPITWDAAMTGDWLADRDDYVYLAPDGLLAYHWHHGNRDLFVDGVEASSAETVRAFWAHIGSHGSMAEKVYARVGPADAFWWLTRERDADVERRSMWMLRLVDAAAAVAARGFAPALSLTVPLIVIDGTCPANSGHWRLTVAEGKGSLLPSPQDGPAGRTPLTLGARGLAALYAGTPLATLRQAGLVSAGNADDDAALDGAFAATPYMLDSF
jgi:predicted acetyltransferase